MKDGRWLMWACVGAAMAACGGETTQPLRATFPLGPADVRLGISRQYPQTLAPEAAFWPASAPALVTDIVVVSDTLIDIGARGETLAGKTLKLDPSTLSVDLADSPIEAVELYLAPVDVTTVGDGREVLLAHAAVPRLPSVQTQFTWTEQGPQVFADALQGRLGETTGATSFVLLLKGIASVSLVPSEPLPVGTKAGKLMLEIPLRYSP